MERHGRRRRGRRSFEGTEPGGAGAQSAPLRRRAKARAFLLQTPAWHDVVRRDVNMVFLGKFDLE